MLNFNHTPLIRLLTPFLVGILSSVYFQLNKEALLIGLSTTILLLLFFYIFSNLNASFKYRWLFGSCLNIVLWTAGALLCNLQYYPSANTQLVTSSATTLVIGTVNKPTTESPNSIKVNVLLKGVKNHQKWKPITIETLLYLEKDSSSKSLNLGDLLVFEAKLKETSPPSNPDEFNYKRYLSYHKINYQAYLTGNNWKKLKATETFSIASFSNQIRLSLINNLKEKGLEPKELAVASALILGYKDNIDPDLKNAYSSAGAMHVLAVSGLHVGVIFLIFSQLLSFLTKLKHGIYIKSVLIVLILWMYAITTGLSPSVMRAATMFSFIIVAKAVNRNSNIYNTLAASAFLLLLINPLLIMEVGFQLSYLAVLGIVMIQPWINNWFTFNNWLPRKIWEISAVSIAAQITTSPLGLLYFHQFPNYFLLSNLIVIPLAISILCIGITTLCFSSIPLVGDFLGLILNYLVKALNFSVSYIDKIPYSLTSDVKFNVLDTWLIYLFIVCTLLLVAYRKFKYLLIGSLLLSTFLILNLVFSYGTNNNKKLIVYNINKHTAIGFIDKSNNFILGNTELISDEHKLLFHVQNYWINNAAKPYQSIDIMTIENKPPSGNLFRCGNYFQFYNTRLAVINHHYKSSSNLTKLEVDYLIVSKEYKGNLLELTQFFNFKKLIFDSSCGFYQLKKWISEATQMSLPYFDIKQQGAFEVEL